MGCGASSRRYETETKVIESEDTPTPSVRTSLILPKSATDESVLAHHTGKVVEHYDVKKWSRCIGKGAAGSVFKAVHLASGLERAVKKCYKVRPDDELMHKREAALLSRLDHPNIIKLFEVFDDKRCTYFIFELCMGGELLERLTNSKDVTEMQCASLLAQILRGLHYIHIRHICHRDVKPENFILLDHRPLEKAALKMVDFGSAAIVQPGSFLSTLTGTPAYMAPEVFSHSYNVSCDMWSCGVVTYFILSGALPFDGSCPEEIMSLARVGKYSFDAPEWKHISIGSQEFVARCMEFKPETRMTAEAALHDTWVLQRDVHAEQPHLPAPVLQNLSKFRRCSQLKKTALITVARHLSHNACSELASAFVQMDADDDGELTLDEMTVGLSKTGLQLSSDQIKELMANWDYDHSGKINYTEFVAGTLDVHSQVEEDVCRSVFDSFDSNGDGVLTPDELAHVLAEGEVTEVIGEMNVEELLKEADTDGDGKISFDEFMALVAERTAPEVPESARSKTSSLQEMIKLIESPNCGRSPLETGSNEVK